MNIRKPLSVILGIVVLTTAACSLLPGKGSTNFQDIINGQAGHIRKMKTASYNGDSGAIIFTMYRMGDSKLTDTADILFNIFHPHFIII
jgi:hypothetical protein